MQGAKALVVVGSLNKVKLNAAKVAFDSVFAHYQRALSQEESTKAEAITTEFEYQPVDAPSGVRAQPIGEKETIQGALNRIAYLEKQHPTAQVRRNRFCNDSFLQFE